MRSDRHGADRAVERRCGTSVAIRTLCLGDAWGRDGGYSRLSGGVSGGWGVEVLHVLAFTRFFNTVCIVTAGDGVTSVVTSHVSHGCGDSGALCVAWATMGPPCVAWADTHRTTGRSSPPGNGTHLLLEGGILSLWRGNVRTLRTPPAEVKPEWSPGAGQASNARGCRGRRLRCGL